MFKKIAMISAFILGLNQPAAAIDVESVITSDHRAESASRDQYRHPAETLKFFGVEEDMTVVEIWPGGKGWYSEILAPFLKDQGKLYAAHFNADSTSQFYRSSREKFTEKLKASPERYENVVLTSFNPPEYVDIAPPGSADRVLTFRNVHNWYMRGGGDARVLSAFQAFYQALKPGGKLGVVEHRLADERPLSDQEASGYMRQDYVQSMAEKAGFVFIAESNINRNPKDSTDHPKGVWTLPPSLRLGEHKRDHYLAIGESDRMTLLFQKPMK